MLIVRPNCIGHTVNAVHSVWRQQETNLMRHNMKKAEPNGHTCAVCSEPLFGKQKRFCSPTHHDKWWANIREKGKELPVITPDFEIQAFISDFLRLLQSHERVVERIINDARSD